MPEVNSTLYRSRGLARTCPDCRAVVRDGVIAHDETCPIARIIEAVKRSDANTFLEDTALTQFLRLVTVAEIQEAAIFGDDISGCDAILVTNLGGGFRLRQPVIIRDAS